MGRCTLAKDESTRNARTVSRLIREVMAENGVINEDQALKLLVDIEDVHIFERYRE